MCIRDSQVGALFGGGAEVFVLGHQRFAAHRQLGGTGLGLVQPLLQGLLILLVLLHLLGLGMPCAQRLLDRCV